MTAKSGRLQRGASTVIAWFLTVMVCGCDRAPSFNVLGSFFPGWILCIVVGSGLAVVVRFVLHRKGWETKLRAVPLLYVSVAVFFGCVLWLVFFE
jgi:YtcA family